MSGREQQDIELGKEGSNDQASEEIIVRDEAPNGGYGWVCVACCFVINAHTWGINSVGSRSFPRLG